MEINLTKEQYKTLMTIVYCGEWMLNSHKTKEDKQLKEIEALEQYLFSFAKESGLSKWVEYDEELKRYFPTEQMEENLHKFVEKYNNRQGRFL